MNPNDPPKTDRPGAGDDDSSFPISDAALAVILVILAVVIVVGYLFVSKLADISHEEDCILARRKNCAALALPPKASQIADNLVQRRTPVDAA
jgi:hypothetical protein